MPSVTLRKLRIALAVYAALAVATGLLIRGAGYGQQIRLALWILFGGLALKSWVAYKMLRPPDGPDEGKGGDA